jgi:MYXO-CTERM domain-containing protein
MSVTVLMLAMVAAAGCDSEGSRDSLTGEGNRFPQRGATDDTTAPDPDSKAGSSQGSTNTTPGGEAPSNPGNGMGNGTGAGNGTGGGTGNGTGGGTGNGTGGGTGNGTGGGTGAGNTVVLNTYAKVWVSGDDKGPNKLGRITGAGTMDAAFAWDSVAYATDKTKVTLGTVYTRSDNQANNNNSYMQGGFALATLTDKGVVPGPEIALPRLNGDRTFMRPLIGFTKNHVVLIAASEDNGINNNPQPVLYVANKTTGQLTQIPNNTRGNTNLNKPTNLIQQALKNGIQVNNPNNQRGPHTVQQVNDNTFVVGMQYNNQAQEAFSVTVNDDASVKMNWLRRYSNTAQHCRPQVAIAPGAATGFIAAVEANNQPAEIGFRVTEFNVATGAPVQSKIVVRSEPNKNKYVSEPVLGIIGDKLGITFGYSSQVRNGGVNGTDNGHAGGKKIDAAVLVSKTDLSVVGTPILGVGQYGRHGSSFITGYGPNAEPALAVISGSSTGTGGGFIQMYPLKADGSLGVKDAAKVYQVSAFSDVANVQARGKRNPNNQARGFINGLGNVPNPGFTTDPVKAATSFMPEVKQFSFSTVTGYSGADALVKGLKNSVWLSLVPAAWREGITTVPGKPTEKPGTNEDGTGPAPRSTSPGTNPSGESGSSGETDVVPDGVDDATRAKTRAASDVGGCSVAMHDASSSSSFGLIALAIAGVITAIRRKREEV